MILCKVSQTAISKAVCYKTKNEQLREKAVHFLLVAINCFYAGLPTVFCTITEISGRFLHRGRPLANIYVNNQKVLFRRHIRG